MGVPIAVKDSQDVAGELTTHGTGCVVKPATADSEMVRRLRAAGAIVIGKTNLPELAFAMFTESPTWGVTRNPWDTERTARRLLRRQRRGGRGRPGSRRHGVGWSRVDPLPGRLLLAVRAEAAAGPGRPRPRLRALARHVRQRVRHPHGARHGAVPDVTAGGGKAPDKPPPPERPFAEAAQAPPGKLRIAASVKGTGRWRPRSSTIAAGAPSRRPPSCWPHSATTSHGGTSTGERWAIPPRSSTPEGSPTTRETFPIPSGWAARCARSPAPER